MTILVINYLYAPQRYHNITSIGFLRESDARVHLGASSFFFSVIKLKPKPLVTKPEPK